MLSIATALCSHSLQYVLQLSAFCVIINKVNTLVIVQHHEVNLPSYGLLNSWNHFSFHAMVHRCFRTYGKIISFFSCPHRLHGHAAEDLPVFLDTLSLLILSVCDSVSPCDNLAVMQQ